MARPLHLVTARQITVARDAPEPVADERGHFYRWLGETLVGRSVSIGPAGDTVYITSEELTYESFKIADYLGKTLPKGRGLHFLVIDLAATPYSQLCESLLIGVADTVQLWAAQAADRSLAILLPAFPHTRSEFWPTLRSLADGRDPAAKLVVISNDGAIRWLHGDSGSLRPDFESVYPLKQDPPQRDPRERMSGQIVRRLGHYASRERNGPLCKRYFFDTGHAAPEIAELAERWLHTTVLADPAVPSDLMLLSKDRKKGLDDAIAGIAGDLRLRFGTFDSEGGVFDPDGNPLDAADIHGTVVLFFAVVSKRQKFERIIRNMRRAGIRLAPRAWTVLATDDEAEIADTVPPLDVERTVRRKASRQQDCEQCTIGLPHTDPLREHHTLRTFDAWEILLTSQWGAERVAPEGSFFRYAPDMGDVFDNYGNWVASKVISLLLTRGLVPASTVFVFPDEERIKRLLVRISTLLRGRPVTIRIPSEVLGHHTSADGRSVAGVRRGRTSSDIWERQLHHLRGSRSKVVMLDEFRASGHTARAMLSLLLNREIQPVAYIPILDFSDETDLDGLPVHPLYRIRATRGGA
ncbi:hypothetical protein OG453_30870 [Streptomyces sp. NBC_01381]|uniref:hypothetical protein n=1 Tax=Streptomyces sp. NBC_01381 TaxID=2903845 RepID=UPI0022541D36|nr:hypothetical protein [Streptomyces sp. NBC_01381]MCX4671046.1 hypothetical protein [Streptomyces sp. NBC_01381]